MLGPSTRLRRILPVHDDPAILRLIGNKLDHAGFEVFIAASGQRAVDVIARRGLPHLAIVDLLTPRMDGLEFCQVVQQFTNPPIIMLTTVDGRGDSHQGH